MPIGEASGESIDLTDSAPYNFKEFVPEGQTEQESTTGKNKYKGACEQGAFDVNGQPYDVASRLRSNDFSEILPNTNYVFSNTKNLLVDRIVYYDTNKTFIERGDYLNSSTFTTLNNNCKYIKMTFKEANNVNITPSDLINPQLEEGTTATEYEPYTGGIPGPNPSYQFPINKVTGDNIIYVNGKNLVRGKISGYAIDGEGVLRSNASYDMQIARVFKDETFTATTDDSQLVCGFYTNYPTTSSVSYNNARLVQASKTFVAPINGYVAFRTNANYKYAQLEPGNTTTTYQEPEQEQTVTISLGSIEMNGIEEYMDYIEGYTDYWKIVKKIKKTTLNLSDVSFANNVGYWGISDRALTTTENQFLYCDKLFFNGNYKSVQNAQNYMQDFQIAVNNNGTSKNIFIRNSTVSTKETFLTWINGLNATICYPLSTPEEIAITDTTLINQLNALAKLMSSKGVTLISQENNNLPFNLKVVYRKDLNIVLQNLEDRIKALEG